MPPPSVACRVLSLCNDHSSDSQPKRVREDNDYVLAPLVVWLFDRQFHFNPRPILAVSIDEGPESRQAIAKTQCEVRFASTIGRPYIGGAQSNATR